MTMKAYITNELSGRGYKRFDEIPEEMFDYLPEYLEDEDSKELVLTADGNEPLAIF